MSFYRRVVERRLAHSDAVDLAAQLVPAVITVIYFGRWERRTYLYGRYSPLLTRLVR